jgi:hypothetical protein
VKPWNFEVSSLTLHDVADPTESTIQNGSMSSLHLNTRHSITPGRGKSQNKLELWEEGGYHIVHSMVDKHVTTEGKTQTTKSSSDGVPELKTV